METLGGQPLSGVGFGIGVDRTLLACRAEEVGLDTAARVEVFGVPLGEAARDRLVGILGGLRRAGIRADLAYGSRGLKGAMKAADRSGARFALVLGERDLEAGEIQLKDLADGSQTAIALDGAAAAVDRAVHGD
jgi:histidyl-tRNA synthetase